MSTAFKICIVFNLFLTIYFNQIDASETNDNFSKYKGYSVIRVFPRTKTQLKYLYDLAVNTTELDFWTFPSALNSPVDIMIPPAMKATFEKVILNKNFEKLTKIKDVEELLTKQKLEMKKSKIRPEFKEVIPGYHDNYQRLAVIHQFLDLIQASAPSLTSVETIGRSTEGRELKLIKIGVNHQSNTKPIIFMDSAIHAREWVSPATLAYFIEYIVSGFNNGDSDIVNLLNTVDFYVAQVINPDGYEYTHTNERMWRKTRSPNAGSTCIGTDPNRNWSYQFGGPGTSTNPCSDIYHGPSAFSEPETKAVSDYILNLGSRVRVYLAVHSYSQLWLYPWGYTDALTPDDEQLKARAITAVNALKAAYGTEYVYGTGTNVLYAAAGAADDWGYGAAHIKYSYTVELRDTGDYGFALPPNQIIPSGIETSAAIIAIARDAINNP